MRKTLQVYSPIKSIIQDIKSEMNFKNESETVAYLVAIRTIYKKKITLDEHQQALKIVKEIENQQTI